MTNYIEASALTSSSVKRMNIRLSIKNPRHEWRGIEAFSLKAYRMRGNKSPALPVLRPKGWGIKPHGKGAVAFHVSAWIETINAFCKKSGALHVRPKVCALGSAWW
ncbi:MAG: hypothetical protein LBJ41_09305 [Treponema sp.]|nr:hypothetical protein [Treponema sp.]